MSKRVAEGYALVAGSFLIIGLAGTLVTWATAPESVLLAVRFATACLILGAVFARRRPLGGVLRRDIWPRLLLMGLLDAFTVLLYFFAVRATGVAAATFFTFIQPVWVALLAPRVLKTPTERVVPLALAIALGGLAVILVPSLLGESARLSTAGILAGLAAGLGYAAFQVLVKGLTRRVSTVTIVIAQTTLDALILLPIALWQTVGTGYRLTGRDLFVALLLGVLCTAVAYTMWTEGMSRLRVQNSAILGFLTPVAAPIYALVFLGQGITPWTVAGGALILLAGVLVVLYGREEAEPEPLM
jgi:drug/metabolite transporter (DMT)-like permease